MENLDHFNPVRKNKSASISSYANSECPLLKNEKSREEPPQWLTTKDCVVSVEDEYLTADEEDNGCNIKQMDRFKVYEEKSSATTTPLTTTTSAPSKPSNTEMSGYVQKKTLAQGMMDLALISANTNQLRYVLDSQRDRPYFIWSLSLIISSLTLQVIVGLALIWNTRFNVEKKREMFEANRVNNISVVGIFLITLINVFISTFGGAPGMLGDVKANTNQTTTTEVTST